MEMDENNNHPVSLNWDSGTAYDLFFSLFVLHKPEDFGLRGAWAAGVRSRLNPQDRKILEEAQEVVPFPFAWIYRLPPPKDGSTVLQALKNLPPEERLSVLSFSLTRTEKIQQVLESVSGSGKWSDEQRKILREESKHSRHKYNPERLLTWWAQPGLYGERYLQALRSYYEVFFAEEERRIAPFLSEALQRGQEMAEQMPWPALIEDLSQGVRLDALTDLSGFVLVPSYWSTPLIVYDRIDPHGCFLFLFGARPEEYALVPGEVVPDALLRALKALADPTRLRIMRYLTADALTPSQLARLLRLRAPTVTHHLNALRLAGLVRLTLEKEGEKRYTVRSESIKGTFSAMQKFLDAGETDPR